MVSSTPCALQYGFVSSFLPALLPTRRTAVSLRTSSARPSQCAKRDSPISTSMVASKPTSKRDQRRALVQSEKFNRLGFKDSKLEAEDMMNSEFTSDLVAELREAAYTLQRGEITIKLAKAYGFCWGVERAVAMAYETRKQFPGHRIHITNEIIHNPIVNNRLREMNIFFVPENGLEKDFSAVESGDVVILPAFGATLEQMQELHDKGCQIVDTTCPWVSKVWGTLDRHKRASCTSIIHGKWKHEETLATTSFAETYLVILNIDEAHYVCDYITNGGDKAAFLAKFENAMSEGFDPDTDLQAVGIANQTTMLKTETAAIGKLFEKTMMEKYGTVDLQKHFVAYDTICDATQERQDAMVDLLAEGNIDLMLVVGGFNSSNTSHLQEMAEHANVTSYWVAEPSNVGPGNRILYRSSDGEEHVMDNFLDKGPLTIGVTSGASTPDKVVEDVLSNVMMIHQLD